MVFSIPHRVDMPTARTAGGAAAKPRSPRQSSRQTVLCTAISLIRNHSYESVGINEICAKSGVTKGCFYHHFESKAALFEAAADYYWGELQPILDAAVSPTLNGLEQLRALLHAMVRAQMESDGAPVVAGCPFFATAAQIGHREPRIAASVLQLAEQSRRYLVVVLQNLKSQEFIEPIEDIERTARLLQHYHQGIMQFNRATLRADVPFDELATGIARLIHLKPQHLHTLLEDPANYTI